MSIIIFVAGLDVFPSYDLVGIPGMHFRHFWGGPRIERAIGSVQLSSLHRCTWSSVNVATGMLGSSLSDSAFLF